MVYCITSKNVLEVMQESEKNSIAIPPKYFGGNTIRGNAIGSNRDDLRYLKRFFGGNAIDPIVKI